MGNVFAIFKREVGSAFDSPLAYIVVPTFLGLVAVGTIWYEGIFDQGVVSLRRFFTWSALLFLLLVPALTMRLFAEEMRTGSLEMLVTLPITEAEVVLGKYLSTLALLALALLLTLSYPLTMASLGALDWGPVLGGYLGLLLMGAAFCAIGTAASAFTSNQVVAFLISFAVGGVPFTMGFFLHRVPATILPIVQHLSFDYHFGTMVGGVLDSRNLIFYGSVVALGLYLAGFALRHRRLV